MYHGKHHTIKLATFICIGFLLVCLNSCSPNRRFSRLLRNYPYLLETKIRDSIVIRQGKVVDTTLLIKATYDTIRLSTGTTIIRNADTFRFVTRIQPCTTFIQKRETIFPKEKRKETKERPIWEIFERVSLILLCLLLSLSLLFKRNRNA